MTRDEALETARINRKHHMIAQLEFTMNVWPLMTDIEAREQMQRDLDRTYGYLHGWYIVEGHSFNNEMITGVPYDADQGGWAWL